MLVVFGSGKCPMCGDFGKQLDKKAMLCAKCNVAFDEFVVAGNVEHETMLNMRYWN